MTFIPEIEICIFRPQASLFENTDFTLRVQNIEYEKCALRAIWDIITEYIHDDEVLYLKNYRRSELG